MNYLNFKDAVICPHCHGQYRRRGLARQIHYAHGNIQIHTKIENDDVDDDENRNRLIHQVFTRVFGAPLVNSIGSEVNYGW